MKRRLGAFQHAKENDEILFVLCVCLAAAFLFDKLLGKLI